MADIFMVEVATNYPHRFDPKDFQAIYDKDGYIIGAVRSVRTIDEYLENL